MADAPLLHKVPSLMGWPGSPSMLTTWPRRVETTWPQPTPQKGQTVVVGVEPAVLIGGLAGAHPACDRAPIARVPVVNPPRNWRRVGPGGWPGAPSAPSSRFTLSSSFILASTCGFVIDLGHFSNTRPSHVATNK